MQVVDAKDLDPTHPRRVVIAGGGYAGITAAVTLAQRARREDGIEVVLVDPRPYQQALSELDLVAAGTPRPQFAELWHAAIFRGLPIKVVYDRLEAVDPSRPSIWIGPRGCPTCEVPAWKVVLATGAIPQVPPVPGLREAAITMWSVSDAQDLQRAIERQFKLAGVLDAPEERALALSFTVVGGGATGVEIVGTIAGVLPKMIRACGYDPGEIRVTLVEGRSDILYDLPVSQRERAKRRLARMGVRLRLGSKVARVEDGVTYLEDGAAIPSPVLVWCGGAQADPDAVSWGLASDNSGRIVCEPCLKASGTRDIYVIGDVAAFRGADGRVIPMLCQFAIREAEHAADNILREARGRDCVDFRANMHGEFVSIGPHYGVGWMFGVNVSGWVAIVLKRLTYIVYWLEVGSFRLAWSRTRQMLRMHR